MPTNPFLSMLPGIVPYTNPNEVRLKDKALALEEAGLVMQNNLEKQKLSQMDALQRAQLDIESRRTSDALFSNKLNARVQQNRTDEDARQFERNPLNIKAWEDLTGRAEIPKIYANAINQSHKMIEAITKQYGIKIGEVKTILDNQTAYSKTIVDAAQAINKEWGKLEDMGKMLGGSDQFSQWKAYQSVDPQYRQEFKLTTPDTDPDIKELVELLMQLMGGKSLTTAMENKNK